MNTFTTPKRQGYRDFDLPKEHLLDERHYVPPKTYDPSEIARRQELTPGTLLAETQLRGIQVAKTILENIDEQEGLFFAAEMLSVAGINTAWYSYAQNSDVMRRRLKLPILTDGRASSADHILEDSVELLSKQAERAGQLVVANEFMLSTKQEHQKRVGLGVGNFSLRLAMIEPVSRGALEAINGDDELAQLVARKYALATLEKARQAHRYIGSHPSIAQLSDPYSHLAVYWHRNAPGVAQSAVADALSA